MNKEEKELRRTYTNTRYNMCRDYGAAVHKLHQEYIKSLASLKAEQRKKVVTK